MMPTKAAYQRFEEFPDEEYDHVLAENLGMTVACLRAQLPAAEWVAWKIYHGRKAQRAELEAMKAR